MVKTQDKDMLCKYWDKSHKRDFGFHCDWALVWMACETLRETSLICNSHIYPVLEVTQNYTFAVLPIGDMLLDVRGLKRVCLNNFNGGQAGGEELLVGGGQLVLSHLCCQSRGWRGRSKCWRGSNHVFSSFHADAFVGWRAYSVHWRRTVCASYIASFR